MSRPVSTIPMFAPLRAAGLDLPLGGRGYMTVEENTWIQNDFTIEGWVYARDDTSGACLLDFAVATMDADVKIIQDSVQFILTDAQGRFALKHGQDALESPAPLPLREWVHIAATITTEDRSENNVPDQVTRARLFLNGKQVASASFDEIISAKVRNSNYIGRSNAEPAVFASCVLDRLRIWDGALTGAQIYHYMNVDLKDTAVLEGPLRSSEDPSALLLADFRMEEGFGKIAFNFAAKGTNLNAEFAQDDEQAVESPAWIVSSRPDPLFSFPPAPPAGLYFHEGRYNYAQVPQTDLIQSELTIECWIYVLSYGAWSRIIDFGNGEGHDNVVLAVSDGDGTGKPVFGVHDPEQPASNDHLTADEKIPKHRWVHLAVTLQNNTSGTDSTGTMYMNGEPKGQEKAMARPAVKARLSNFIGMSHWPDEPNLHAVLYNLRVWKGALTEEEIRENMYRTFFQPVSLPEKGRHTPPVLTGNWPMNEGGGTEIRNYAGDERPAILHSTENTTLSLHVNAWTQTRTGLRGLEFLDQYETRVMIPKGAWFSPRFTAECWLYIRAASVGFRILDFGSNGADNRIQLLLNESTSDPANLAPTAPALRIGSELFQAPESLPLERWVHLAAVLGEENVDGVKAPRARIYFDDKEFISGTLTPPMDFGESELLLFAPPEDLSVAREANIYGSNFRIWNGAVPRTTIDEWRERMLLGPMELETSDGSVSLAGGWNFDEGEGTELRNVADLSNETNGTLEANTPAQIPVPIPGPYYPPFWSYIRPPLRPWHDSMEIRPGPYWEY